MRDIVVTGLMVGMEVTSCSFDKKSVSMQGHVGTITNSVHPVLGPLLDFTPRNNDELFFGSFGVRRTGYRDKVEERWLVRTWDDCMVAQTYYRGDKRRTARRFDDQWVWEQSGTSYTEVSWSVEHGQRSHLGKVRQQGADPQNHDSRLVASHLNADGASLKRHQDGEWGVIIPRESKKRKDPKSEQTRVRERSGPIIDRPPNTAVPDVGPPQERKSPGRHRQATVEEALEEDSNDSNRPAILEEKHRPANSEWQSRLQTARSRQSIRRAKVQSAENDKSLVENSVNRGAMLSPYQPRTLLLTQHPHNHNHNTKPSRHPCRQQQKQKPASGKKSGASNEKNGSTSERSAKKHATAP